jgi:osmoprotectant transport system ATP-binding protein
MSDSASPNGPSFDGPSTDDAEPMIKLEELSKRYPDGTLAVDSVSMDIPEGEIVILVGPSGCGKTTTMRLINRLIEPTSGRITLEGDDVTHVDADNLRRRIGYVIQQIGLLPHQTIAENIGTVPRLLKWDKGRIRKRVDELLDLVGLDPETYRGRYPKELSGGQQQRIGVARAMAADPPVMLMDEPFGATDPITRERLQNEFLRIQEELRKTIVFVTHDIDEAIKMGDRIAILEDQSHVAQFDTPEVVLTNPASSFVEDFIGSGASLKRLNLSRVNDVKYAPNWPVATINDDPQAVMRQLQASEKTAALLLDEHDKPRRWVDTNTLNRNDKPLSEAGLPVVSLVSPGATLRDAVDEMLTSNAGCAVVVGAHDTYEGIVDWETVMGAIQQMRGASEEEFRARKGLQETASEEMSA